MSSWYQDPTLWEETYPFMFPQERFEAGRASVEPIVALAGVEPVLVLDSCCGPGRMAVPFAERGARVTGVDLTQPLLARAREYATDRSVQIEWVESDIRRFVRPGAFDLALNVFTSFGYFSDPHDNQRVLENLAQSLRPGGKLVMDLMGREIVARQYRPVSCSELVDGSRCIQLPKVVDDWQRIENEWLILKDGRYRAFEFNHYLYGADDLSRMLREAGFSEVTLYGNYEGTPYDVDAQRLVAVATR